MSKFRVQMVDAYTNEVLEIEDEIFDTEEDAEEYACELGGCFSQGAEDLSLMGREYTPRDEVEFVVEEIDED